ncbi:MAG: succinate-semialdehyde dehydrogenase / glutarate-semialdehyde dehydrogenase [Nocardioidaceae bacterium]|jgi:succinate-semialdehyde dehydrogenase/glutarate-semialdehyde dehydrogenase|nr:succinate-semialdehyde dehydrogenase / glutarate-semialdehyde dehydrogenase [Nocardioidaceae bacterium]
MADRPDPPDAPAVTPGDPELDPTATYALEPSVSRLLTAPLVASSGQFCTTYAPFTGQPIAAIAVSTVADVALASQRARAAQAEWARVPVVERSEVLLAFHDLVLDRQHEILDLIQLEAGKARKHAFEEVAHAALTARYYARRAARQVGPSRRLGLYPWLTRVDLHRQPKGVVGIISPWNYPFTMALSDGLAALAAGNAIVHKPDSQTCLSALFGVGLLREAGMPAAAWQVVAGEGPVIGPAVVDNVDYVCFTGSTRTGREVGVRAAERLVGASLELGGKNPMLVLRDADLDRAAEGAVRACFSSAGQLCVSMERMYVADQVYDRFLERFLRRVGAMRLSAGLDFDADMGSLVSKRQFDTVVRHVADARAKGAQVLAGGHPRPDVGPLFYAPTVLAEVRPGMSCFGDETFGPVVSVYRFTDEAEAVARANEGPYGLNACVFTRDTRRGRALAQRIRCGTVTVNEGYSAGFGSLDSPMGGMGSSGLGRRQGPDGILRFTQAQTVATQRLLPFRPLPGQSEQGFAATLTATLRLMKWLHRP